MSLFTRTGLLPISPIHNIRSSRRRRQRAPKFDFSTFIIPAPILFRPSIETSIINSPFPKSCSIFCNHPILDDGTKKILKRTKEGLKDRRDRYFGKDPFALKYLESDETDIEDRDPIFVPEILFRHYIQTDSRPPTPTVIVSPLNSVNIHHRQSVQRSHSRRCITPDGNLLNVSEKKSLVVDLRKSWSQSNLTLEGTKVDSLSEQHNSYKHEEWRNYGLEESKLQKRQNAPVSCEITKYKIISKRKCGDKNEQKLTTPADATMQRKSPVQYKLKIEKRVRKSKKKKHKKVLKKSLSVGEYSGIRNFEEADTQISRNIEYTDDEKQEEFKPNKVDQEDEYQTQQNQEAMPADIRNLLLTGDLKTILNYLDSQADSKACFCLKYSALVKSILTPKIIDHRRANSLGNKYGIDLITDNIGRKSSAFRIVFNEERKLLDGRERLLKTFSRKNCRFELPLDTMKLTKMNPLEYLRDFVYITNASRIIYDKTFYSYAKCHSKNEISDNVELISNKEDMTVALTQVLAGKVGEHELKFVSELVGWNEDSRCQVDRNTWHGLCAFCERIFAEKTSCKYLSRIDDPCDELEEADFSNLECILSENPVSDELRKLLFLIKSS